MPTPFESAQLNLKLFELRREPVLREARAWFLAEFNPESFADLSGQASGPRNAAFRMVLGYWEMAASLVTAGAIDGDAFRAAHGEIFLTFAKIHMAVLLDSRVWGVARMAGLIGGAGSITIATSATGEDAARIALQVRSRRSAR
jgi:hypothetical protein